MAREWTEKHIRELIKAEMANLDDGNSGGTASDTSIRKGLRNYMGMRVAPAVFAEGYNVVNLSTSFVGYIPQMPGPTTTDKPIYISKITISTSGTGFSKTGTNPHLYISDHYETTSSGSKMFFEYNRMDTKTEDGEISYNNIDTSLTVSSDISKLTIPTIVQGTLYTKDGKSTGITLKRTETQASSIRVGSLTYRGQHGAMVGYRFSAPPSTGTYYILTHPYYFAGSSSQADTHPEKLKTTQFNELIARADDGFGKLIERRTYTKPIIVDGVDGLFVQAGAIYINIGSKWEDAKPEGFVFNETTTNDN